MPSCCGIIHRYSLFAPVADRHDNPLSGVRKQIEYAEPSWTED